MNFTARRSVLDQLRDRTVGNVEDAERVIKLAGLDLAKVLERAGGLPDGRGGPAANGDGEPVISNPALATTLTNVENHLTRWESLKSVLKRLPLISPVDHYHLASRFGKRRDPFPIAGHALRFGLGGLAKGTGLLDSARHCRVLRSKRPLWQDG